MAQLFEHTAEGSTDEADVTTSTAYPTAFTSVSKTGSAPTVKYDSAVSMHGTRSIRMTRIAGGDSAYCGYTHGAAVLRMQARAYIYLTALPTAQLNLFVFRHASGFMGYCSINSSGKLQLYNAVSGSIAASIATNAIAVSTWIRVEAAIAKGTTTSNGTIEFAYYTGDSGTATFSYSSSAQNTGTADPIQCRFGLNGSNTTPADLWFDDTAVGDGATGFLGASSVVPPNCVVDAQRLHWIDAVTGSTVSGGTLSFSISQTAGPSITPVLVSTGIWRVAPHSTSDTTYDVTATGSLGGTDVVSVTVPPLSTTTVPVQRFLRVGGVWT